MDDFDLGQSDETREAYEAEEAERLRREEESLEDLQFVREGLMTYDKPAKGASADEILMTLFGSWVK